MEVPVVDGLVNLFRSEAVSTGDLIDRLASGDELGNCGASTLLSPTVG